MKPLFAFILALFFALPAAAHPGKTDRHGGHQCLKDCAEWDLFYREYHMHDKDGRPVRVERKKQAQTAVLVSAPAAAPAVAATSAAPPAAAASVIPVEPETPMLPWLLLALCLMLLLAVRRRARDAEERS